MSEDTRLLGAIEAGGTKFVLAVGTADGRILKELRLLTTAPAQTIQAAAAFFGEAAGALAAIGIASFGPVQLDRNAPDYGFITNTPKAGWRNFDIVGAIRSRVDVPIAFDTDVNAAALAEHRWGAARSLRTFLYVTVGTGIGAGAMLEGSLLHGASHPEMGHMRVPHDRDADPFPGACPYHGDCLEGLASGGAIEARWGAEAPRLPDDHPAWTLEADYLALACANWSCCFAPERIIFGGGVMRPHLVPLIRDRLSALLGGYVRSPEIVFTPLNNRAGVLGALALAADALRATR